jgi:hypothetical protein
MEYRIVLLFIYISLSLYIAVSALDIKDRPTLNNLISGGCTETIINPELITKESIPKKSKRKRIKSKFKKWLSIFSKLDNKNNRVLTYYGMMLAGAIARSASATAVIEKKSLFNYIKSFLIVIFVIIYAHDDADADIRFIR